MADNSLVTTLSQLLQEGVDASNEMVGLLKSEQTALTERAADEIPDIANKKLALLEILNQFEQKRAQLFNQAGIPDPEQTDPQEWFESQGWQQAAELWSQLKEQLRSCRELNQANGSVINKQQKAIANLLSVVRPSSSEAPSTYSSEGKSNYSFSSQTIDKA